MDAIALESVLPRLAIDLIAIAALAWGVYFRRHGRRELFVVYGLFNVGLFFALTVISAGRIGAGVGFGLFAVLSIIRLRSETYSHTELGYFFLALVLALVTGIDFGDLAEAGAFCAALILVAWVVDHPRLLGRPAWRTEMVLDEAIADPVEAGALLERRLGVQVREVTILEVDLVRETTRVVVQCAVAPALASTEVLDVAH